MSEFKSNLQVFKHMESMSAELKEVRSSEENLRKERRAIIKRLREVARNMDGQEQQDEVLGTFVNDLEKLLNDTAPGHATQEVLSSPLRGNKITSTLGRAAVAEVLAAACETPKAAEGQGLVMPSRLDAAFEAASPGGARLTPASGVAVSPVPEEAELSMEDLAVTSSCKVDEEDADEGPDIKRTFSNYSIFSCGSTSSTARSWAVHQPNCQICGKGFAIWRRRHHCRSCGCCCCDECSPFRVRLAAPVQRPSLFKMSVVTEEQPSTASIGRGKAYRVCAACMDQPPPDVDQPPLDELD